MLYQSHLQGQRFQTGNTLKPLQKSKYKAKRPFNSLKTAKHEKYIVVDLSKTVNDSEIDE